VEGTLILFRFEVVGLWELLQAENAKLRQRVKQLEEEATAGGSCA
jgi:cell division protein FtsB